MSDEEAVKDLENDFEAWILHGIERKWISDVVCATHNGLPATDEEEKEWDEGYDPCVPGVRVWAMS